MSLRGNRWQRGADDFAVRVEVEDLKGLFRKELTVEHGTKALFFSGGTFGGTLGPGTYTLDDVFGHLGELENKGQASAVLVDAGDVAIGFRVGPIYTKDPLGIQVRGEVVLKVAEPIAFFTNVMKARTTYQVVELKDLLDDELTEALSAMLAERSVEELSTRLELRNELEMRLANHLRTTLGRIGLDLIQLRGLAWIHEKIDRVRNLREECFLLVSESEANLDRRKRLFDVYTAEEIQEVAELTRKAQIHRDKAKVWADLRRAANDDKLDEVRSAEDLAREIQAVDKQKLLREDEWSDLTSQLKFGAESKEAERRFIAAKARLEEQAALGLATLAAQKGVVAAEVELAALQGRRSVAEELAREADRVAQRRREGLEDALADRKIQLERAEGELDRKRIDVEVKRLEQQLWKERIDDRQEALERMKQRRLDLELKKQERELEMRIREERERGDLERKRGETEIDKLKVYAGMTEEQILATQAAQSAEIAKAFQKKFEGPGSVQAEAAERTIREMKEAYDKSLSFAGKALDANRDVGVAAASAPRVAGVPVVGASVPGVGGSDVILCDQCKGRVPAGQKFCHHCGQAMF